MNWYIKVLRHSLNFKGRARRKEFWLFFLFNILISYGIVFLNLDLEIPELVIFSTVYSFGILVPSISVAIRRMHDVNKSGWYMLIPVCNIILACKGGDRENNMYGPNPKSEQH